MAAFGLIGVMSMLRAGCERLREELEHSIALPWGIGGEDSWPAFLQVNVGGSYSPFIPLIIPVLLLI